MSHRTATASTTNGSTSAEPTAATDAPILAIDGIAEETILVPILGTSPIIVHRFSEKAKRQMLDAAQGRQTPKQPKDPEAEYRSAFYLIEEDAEKIAASPIRAPLPDGIRPGLPASAFKQATVGAARFYGKAVSMAALKQFVFVRGEMGSDGRQLIEIVGDVRMREDVVKVGRGGTDLRYRPEFWPWSATLEVSYFVSVLTRASVLSLIDAGGMAVGVGEWRPEKDGEFGCYRVDTDRKVEVLS